MAAARLPAHWWLWRRIHDAEENCRSDSGCAQRGHLFGSSAIAHASAVIDDSYCFGARAAVPGGCRADGHPESSANSIVGKPCYGGGGAGAGGEGGIFSAGEGRP